MYGEFDSQGVFETAQPHTELNEVLRGWLEELHTYSEHYRDRPDVPWWYNERASVSVFAGSVARRKGLVLEEYSSQKKLADKDAKYTGRCDLWFAPTTGVNGALGYECETKQYWPPITQSISKFEAYMKDGLTSASSDACALSAPGRNRDVRRGAVHLGMLFLSPIISPRCGKDSEKVNKQIRDCIQKAQERCLQTTPTEVKVAAGAYYFKPRHDGSYPVGNGEHVFPGVVLLLGHAGATAMAESKPAESP